MNSKLLDYIKILSKRDKKTLSQKTLKTYEELGELSKAILPYDNAPGTNHRLISRNKILEEVSDSLLCLLSVAYDLDFSDEEISDMMWSKSAKWSSIQERELNLQYPLPYEIHVTVKNPNISLFKDICHKIGVKPIVLDLQNKQGDVVDGDVMTSSKISTDNKGALAECERIVNELSVNGFSVVRQKIETVPWHPAAPRLIDYNVIGSMPKDCYFECHFNVITTNDKLDHLTNLCEDMGCHRSRNILKKHDDNLVTIMVTKRDYNTTYEKFKKDIDIIESYFERHSYNIEKTIIEFSVYDTKIDHDASWLKN